MDITSSATYQAFWSYNRRDNEADSNRIIQLSEDIKREYSILSGDKLTVFTDIFSIEWGDDWQQKISEALQGIAFLIPVLTPNYFKSSSCRDELARFSQAVEAAGLNQLLLSIRYVPVPELSQEEPADELIALVKRYNWVDWEDLRFEERDSGAYRKAVNNLASR